MSEVEMLDFEAFKERYEKVPVEEYPNNVCEAVPEPVVSVHLLTYNHVDYIRDAIESVLMQEVDFPLELVIGDDNSSDGTREICIEYAKQYPELIRLQLHHRENNIELHGSPTHLFQYWYNTFSARGRYISIISGDDYWTDSRKVKRQCETLKNRKNAYISFHNAKRSPNTEETVIDKRMQNKISAKELRSGWAPPASTVTFKNKLTRIPSVFDRCINEDMLLSCILGGYGSAFYESQISDAIYRSHGDNLWSKKYKKNFALISTYRCLATLNQFRGYNGEAYECKSKMINSCISHYAKNRETNKIIKWTIKIVTLSTISKHLSISSVNVKKYTRWILSSLLSN